MQKAVADARLEYMIPTIATNLLVDMMVEIVSGPIP